MSGKQLSPGKASPPMNPTFHAAALKKVEETIKILTSCLSRRHYPFKSFWRSSFCWCFSLFLWLPIVDAFLNWPVSCRDCWTDLRFRRKRTKTIVFSGCSIAILPVLGVRATMGYFDAGPHVMAHTRAGYVNNSNLWSNMIGLKWCRLSTTASASFTVIS